ncbi:MAG: winged helix-turn-helix transcriptional regulator [Christensenellaceae bacterium]|nr:winged helix-turn-helix transcriptional regulator [Christensenellaceae bacterium]
MISYEPFPLLEAYSFLCQKCTDFSVETFFRKMILRQPDRRREYETCCGILSELWQQLEASIPVPIAEVRAFFAPLRQNDKISFGADAATLADILIGDQGDFASERNAAALLQTENAVKNIQYRIMAAVSGAAFPDEPDGSFSAAELFQAVNRSDFPESSKLLLADAALDPAGNIDRLNNMLHPIAAAFSAARELWLPLIEFYRKACGECGNAQRLITLLTGIDLSVRESAIEEYKAFPSVCLFGITRVLTPVPPETDVIGYIGVLQGEFKHAAENSANKGSELSRTLEIMGDQTRFDILCTLADHPAYGRELANLLGISTSTVSQHMITITGAGLVCHKSVGRKTYYSLNRENVRRMITLLCETLLKETPVFASETEGTKTP